VSKTRGKRNPKFEWQSAFIEARITGNTGFIGLLMSTFDNGDGKGFFLSAPTMANMTGMDERTIRTHVKRLQEAGWIRTTRRGGRRGLSTFANEYELTIPASSQPGGSRTEPGDPSSQPEQVARPVDQASLHQSPLDQVHLDVSTLSPGDEISEKAWQTLDGSQRQHFHPSFERDGVMVYEPPRVPPQSPADLRPPSQQLRSHERMLRDEGLDEHGDPIKNRSRSRRRP
jgi:hypothetical protein